MGDDKSGRSDKAGNSSAGGISGEASRRAALVYYWKTFAGILREKENGFEFRYDLAYLEQPDALPISFSMPLRKEPYVSDALFPFFAGMLPEGWLLNIILRAAKIDESDKFGLLLHVGREPVGAVNVRPMGDEGLHEVPAARTSP